MKTLIVILVLSGGGGMDEQQQMQMPPVQQVEEPQASPDRTPVYVAFVTALGLVAAAAVTVYAKKGKQPE